MPLLFILALCEVLVLQSSVWLGVFQGLRGISLAANAFSGSGERRGGIAESSGGSCDGDVAQRIA